MNRPCRRRSSGQCTTSGNSTPSTPGTSASGSRTVHSSTGRLSPARSTSTSTRGGRSSSAGGVRESSTRRTSRAASGAEYERTLSVETCRGPAPSSHQMRSRWRLCPAGFTWTRTRTRRTRARRDRAHSWASKRRSPRAARSMPSRAATPSDHSRSAARRGPHSAATYSITRSSAGTRRSPLGARPSPGSVSRWSSSASALSPPGSAARCGRAARTASGNRASTSAGIVRRCPRRAVCSCGDSSLGMCESPPAASTRSASWGAPRRRVPDSAARARGWLSRNSANSSGVGGTTSLPYVTPQARASRCAPATRLLDEGKASSIASVSSRRAGSSGSGAAGASSSRTPRGRSSSWTRCQGTPQLRRTRCWGLCGSAAPVARSRGGMKWATTSPTTACSVAHHSGPPLYPGPTAIPVGAPSR